MTGFTAFIDESGDEGYNIVPPPDRKASEWFILGCAVVANADIGRLEGACSPNFHFRKAHHHACVSFAERISQLPITAILVAFHKPSVPDNAAIRTKSHYLFDYSSKLLAERISWYCGNHPQPGAVKLIFSDRAQLKLQRIQEYFRRLRTFTFLSVDGVQVFDAKNSIKWKYLDPDQIDKQPHDSLPGLQIADTVVSGAAKAIEWSPSYNTEHRYIKIIRDRFYRHNGRCTNYGIKLMPSDIAQREHNAPRQRFHWLHHFR